MAEKNRPSLSGRRAAGALLACAALAVSLGGCGRPAQPEAEAEPAPETPAAAEAPEPEEPELAVPDASFLTFDGVYTVSGEPVEAFTELTEGDDGWRHLGLLTEDRAVMYRTSSEHDDEWDTDYDERLHLMLVDGKGEKVADLDEVLSAHGTPVEVDQHAGTESVAFVDGVAMLPVVYENGTGGRATATVVIDRDGKEVFSAGDAPGCTVQGAFSDSPLRFFGGERFHFDSKGVVDATGRTLGTVATDGSVELVGPGHYATRDNTVGNVYNLDGSPVVNVEDLSSGDISFGFRSIDKLLGDDLLLVEGSQANPHGGSSRTVRGIYDVGAGSWVVEPTPGLLDAAPSYDGTVFVDARSEDVLDGTYTEADSAKDGYSCILSADGTLLFDLAKAGVDTSEGAAFDAVYLGSGYWYVDPAPIGLEGGAKGLVVYIDEDGAYVGAQPVGHAPVTGYGDLNAAGSVNR